MSPSHAIVVPPELRGERLDRVLERLVADRTRAQLTKLVRRGGVKVDGRAVHRSNVRVKGGERLTLELDAGRGSETGLEVIFEDADLVAVNKPAGLLTHPTARGEEDSLAARLEARYGPLPRLRGDERPGIVHRLDRETSGLVVAARTPEAMEALGEAFRARAVEKRYAALVQGLPEWREYEVDLALASGPQDGERVVPDPEGRTAHTRFERREALGPVALVAAFPTTGRRHQIRVHAAEAGHPVLFDALYRPRTKPALPAGAPLLRRHALHAEALVLPHPRTGEPLRLEAPPAPDFARLLAWLRERAAP